MLAIKASFYLHTKVFKASAPPSTHSPTPHPPCAGRNSIPRYLLSFLRWPHFKQILLFSLSFLRWPHFRDIRLFTAHFRFCAGRIADRSISSLPSFLPALAAFSTWDRDFQFSGMSLLTPLSPGELCFFDEDSHGTSSQKFPFAFRLYSQTPERLSSSLVAYIGELHNSSSPSEITLMQIQGIQRWKDLSSVGYSHLTTEEHLQLYSECINDIFFGRLLKGLYKLSVVDIKTIPGALALVRPNDSPSHPETLPSRRTPEVFIKIGKESDESPEPHCRLALLKYYLELLLHEMVHAVFIVYCCQTCPSCAVKYKDEVGCSGHSILWQRVANAIESAVNRNECFRIHKGHFDLYRSRSFHLEYTTNPNLRETLTIYQLGSLNLNGWTSRDGPTTTEIQDLLQVRDKQRSVIRRKKAAEDRKRGPQPKPSVAGGRISKSNRPNPRG